IGSGVMDRYPNLRIGTLEAGHGWLPFRMARIDEHAETVKAALSELAHKPSEYVLGGRYFQSIEIPEGERLTNSVIDLLGEDLLMYASDYPWRKLVPRVGDDRPRLEYASRTQAQALLGQRRAVLRTLRLGVNWPGFNDRPRLVRRRRTKMGERRA